MCSRPLGRSGMCSPMRATRSAASRTRSMSEFVANAGRPFPQNQLSAAAASLGPASVPCRCRSIFPGCPCKPLHGCTRERTHPGVVPRRCSVRLSRDRIARESVLGCFRRCPGKGGSRSSSPGFNVRSNLRETVGRNRRGSNKEGEIALNRRAAQFSSPGGHGICGGKFLLFVGLRGPHRHRHPAGPGGGAVFASGPPAPAACACRRTSASAA